MQGTAEGSRHEVFCFFLVCKKKSFGSSKKEQRKLIVNDWIPDQVWNDKTPLKTLPNMRKAKVPIRVSLLFRIKDILWIVELLDIFHVP